MFLLKYSDQNGVLSAEGGEGPLNIDYAERAKLFLDTYKGQAGSNAAGEAYNTFALSQLGTTCSTYPYGYTGAQARPCIFLKFNKIWGWEPTPIEEQDFADNPEWPESFKKHWETQGNKNKVWVDCRGRYAADQEVVDKAMKYFPEDQGFDVKYFPFAGNKGEDKKDYQSPLVAVQFDIPEENVGQLIHVECRAYYQGVKHETKSKAGLVQFEVMLKHSLDH